MHARWPPSSSLLCVQSGVFARRNWCKTRWDAHSAGYSRSLWQPMLYCCHLFVHQSESSCSSLFSDHYNRPCWNFIITALQIVVGYSGISSVQSRVLIYTPFPNVQTIVDFWNSYSVLIITGLLHIIRGFFFFLKRGNMLLLMCWLRTTRNIHIWIHHLRSTYVFKTFDYKCVLILLWQYMYIIWLQTQFGDGFCCCYLSNCVFFLCQVK